MALSLEQIKVNAAARAAEKTKVEAIETASKESEARKGELTKKLESAESKMNAAQSKASEAQAELTGLTELERQIADDPESLAEIQAAKAEHQQTISEFETAKNEFEAIKAEISSLEFSASDANTETPAKIEKPVEAVPELHHESQDEKTSAPLEATKTRQETVEDIFAGKSYGESSEAMKNLLGANPQTRIRDVEDWFKPFQYNGGGDPDALRSNAEFVRNGLKVFPDVKEAFLKKMSEFGKTDQQANFEKFYAGRVKQIEDLASQMEERASQIVKKADTEKGLQNDAKEYGESPINFNQFDLTGSQRAMKKLMDDPKTSTESLKAARVAFVKKMNEEGASEKFIQSFEAAFTKRLGAG